MFNKKSKVNFTTAYFSEFSPFRGYRVSDNMIVLTKHPITKGEETVLSSGDKVFLTTIVNPKTNAELVLVSTYDNKHNVFDSIIKFCSEFSEFNDFVLTNKDAVPKNIVIKGTVGNFVAIKHHYAMEGVN